MRNIFLQFLTCGTLIGFSNGVPLIGQNVRDAGTNEFLFVVSIALKDPQGNLSIQERHHCTGALISKKSVLTAGHCLVGLNKEDVVIIAGSADLRLGHKYYPESWTTYDQWRSGINYIQHSINDIAIITLICTGIKDTNIIPAPILTFPLTDLYNSNVRVAGWGASEDGTNPAVLQTAILKVISNQQCESKITRVLHQRFTVSYNYFCSLAEPWLLSSCGDSGGPIINKQNQIVAINIGACPKLYSYEPEFVHTNQVNTHLSLFNYRYFIKAVMK